ncbi:TonB-dependent receptor plug domain-containing protein [Flavobacterium sp.]|uniref:TonB-dependent receptor plug domain-containing protein n=1 Tax=Flavobacterium sp. TaxID=239 RepID=UPI003D0A56D1
MKNIYLCCMILVSGLFQAQYRIIGNVRTESNDQNLANVKVIFSRGDEKTFFDQTFTDNNGNFVLESTDKLGKLIFRQKGYKSVYKFLELKEPTTDIGTFYLEELLVKELESESALVDLAFYRKSPTATSTLYESQNFNTNSNKDFIERTAYLPGVYTTTLGGGFADAQIRMRGYDETSITPIVDGISLRNFETGTINWSFIAPISDALDAIQIQRGLGSSKLNASVAGTMNFILRDPFKANGNFIATATGNDGYAKHSINLSSGEIKKGFGVNFTLTSTKGDGYVRNTDFNALGYYLALGYKAQKNTFVFKLLGAPTHRNTNNKIATIDALYKYHGGVDNRYNFTYGNYKGQKISLFENTVHMPMATLEWKYDINANNTLTAKGYGIFGVSGQTRYAGTDPSFTTGNFYTANGTLDFDFIERYNRGLATNTIEYEDMLIPDYLRTTLNDSNGNPKFLNSIDWETESSGYSLVNLLEKKTSYGLLLNYTTKLDTRFKLDTGIEALRSMATQTKYLGNLFGADGYIIDPNTANTFTTETYNLSTDLLNVFEKTDKQKIDFYNKNYADYVGMFSQLEFNTSQFNFLLQGGYSFNQYYKTSFDLYDNAKQEDSKKVNLDNFHAKFGVNWNINRTNNIWLNLGIVNRAPIFNSVFKMNNAETTMMYGKEKFRAAEFGYSYIAKRFNLNFATYYNALFDSTLPLNDITLGYIGVTDRINKTNIGAELDLTFRLLANLTIASSNSYAHWLYDTDAQYVDFDPKNPTTNLFIKNKEVGGAPQWMSSLSLLFQPFKNFTWTLAGKYHTHFHSNTAPEQFDPYYYPRSYASDLIELPDFTLFDTALKYKLQLKNKHAVMFALAMNNILDTLYINESTRSYANSQVKPNGTTYGEFTSNRFKGVNGANAAFFGLGRTWNFGVQYSF